MRFQRMTPVVFVSNLGGEVAFYEALGFEIEPHEDQFPDFIAMRQGELTFGIELRVGFDPEEAAHSVLWHFEVDDLAEAVKICEANFLRHTSPRKYRSTQEEWSMTIWSPNGWKLSLEGPYSG